jgi:hypothetical protein
MKKSIVIASFLALSGLTAPVVMAAPSTVEINFVCPGVTGVGALYNFGSYIGGYGQETINGNPSTPNSPFFTYNISSGANIPANLADGVYASSGTNFDNSTSKVSCTYTSSATPAFDPITVDYTLTNATFISLTSQTVDSINLVQYLGLRSNPSE